MHSLIKARLRKTGRIACAAAVLAFGAPVAGHAQQKHDFSGMMLTNQMGELCTMCEADMTCTVSDGAAIAYHFQKRGFLGQMATVLDYFPLTQKWGLRHTRPVTVKGSGTEAVGEATFDLEAKRISVPGPGGMASWVDRTDGSWHGADGAVIGACTAQKI